MMLLIRGRGRNFRLVTLIGVCLSCGIIIMVLRSDDGNRMNHWGLGIDEYHAAQVQIPSDSDDPLDVIPRQIIGNAGTNTSISSCQEKHSFVYIKMIKCGSTTLANMFRMFGAKRRLSCVLPLSNKIYLGWPHQIQEGYYRPPLSGGFDFLVDHMIHNKTAIDRIIPGKPVYITSLREPFSQFKSTFNYYNLKNIMKISNVADPIREYLMNSEKYENVYQSSEASKTRYCIPDGFSMTYNLMAFNLGFPTGWPAGTSDKSSDTLFISRFIEKLDTEFGLVLITEYMAESLILLKRTMCWKLSDILHMSGNVGKYNYKNTVENDLVNIYKQRSAVDFSLYQHFNNTLWTKIRDQGDEFWSEVSHLRDALKRLETFCRMDTDARGDLELPADRWNPEIHMSSSDCEYLDDFDTLGYLKKEYDRQSSKDRIQLSLPRQSFC